MYGGLTGFGMYEDDEYDYEEEPESLGGLLLGGARRRKKKSTPAMTHLRRFMAAEKSAIGLERKEGHPQFAKRIAEDYGYNKSIKKSPAWMTKKYHDIYDRPAPKRKTASMSRSRSMGSSRSSTAGKIFNASTGRMVSLTGSIGRAILASSRQEVGRNPPKNLSKSTSLKDYFKKSDPVKLARAKERVRQERAIETSLERYESMPEPTAEEEVEEIVQELIDTRRGELPSEAEVEHIKEVVIQDRKKRGVQAGSKRGPYRTFNKELDKSVAQKQLITGMKALMANVNRSKFKRALKAQPPLLQEMIAQQFPQSQISLAVPSPTDSGAVFDSRTGQIGFSDVRRFSVPGWDDAQEVGRDPLQKLSKAQQKVFADIYEEIENAIPIQLTPLKEQQIKTEIAEELKAEEEEMDMDIDEFLLQLSRGFSEEEGSEFSGDGLHGGALSIDHIKKMLKASYKGHSIGIGGKGENPPERIDDFILDKQLSGQYGVVYFNPRTGQTVVVHRGTKEAMDWTNNAMYAMGLYKFTNRYKTGLQMQRKAEKKYGAKNITTLGHSQGAILARELGQNTKEIITLNPAYKGEKPLKNEYNIRSSGDLVSVGLHGTRRGHDLLIGSKGFNPLDEHMIDILDRVDGNKMFGAN